MTKHCFPVRRHVARQNGQTSRASERGKDLFRKAVITLFLTSIAVLSGCGVAHVKTNGQSTDLQQYNQIVIGDVKVYSREAAAKDNADLQVKLNQWQKNADQQFRNYVETIQAQLPQKSPQNPAKILVANLDMEVTYGNRAMRYWVGFGAGKGSVNSVLSVNDGQTNAEQFSASSDSDLSVGAFGGDIGSVFESNLEKLLQQYPQGLAPAESD